MLKRQPGDVDPSEYDWKKQFGEDLQGQYGYVPMDTGKVRGLAIRLEKLEIANNILQQNVEALQQLTELQREKANSPSTIHDDKS